MATPASHILLLLLALVALTPSTSASSPNLDFLDLHDLLITQGFPPGLLPDPVENFTVGIAGLLPLPTYSFIVHFKNPCYVQYQLTNYFAPVFTGKITWHKISEMTGHKDHFQSGDWIDMYDVTRVGEKLVFRFATTTETYDKSLFEEVKTCTDGPLLPDNSNQLISQVLLTSFQ